ncbi:MAG: hypothetical protein WDW36_003187 [Sanguina aurantia]
MLFCAHMQCMSPGEFILRNRPQAVVVETAIVPEHGAMPGNIITCNDTITDPAAAFFMRMFCQVADRLRVEDGDPWESELWKTITKNYNGEQLTYVGALTTGAHLVFGDRPKDITYRRLLHLTTLKQLDEGYSHQCVANATAILGLPPSPYEPESLPVSEQIMMQEREAVMLQVVHEVCKGAHPHLVELPPFTSVVMVLGNDHMTGLRHLLDSGKWQQMVGWGPLASSDLLFMPGMVQHESEEHAATDMGLRRGLLASMMRLSVNQQVMEDMDCVLGPVPERHRLAYDAVNEVYGSPRMKLACLPAALLAQVVTGHGCDMEEVLQPMRDVRPSNGGPGFSEEMVTYVRALNYDLD